MKRRAEQEVVPCAHLKEPESFDQTADLVLQGEDHGRLPSSLSCLPVSRFINGTEGRTPGLQETPQTSVSNNNNNNNTVNRDKRSRPSQQVTVTTSTVGKSRRTRDKQANNSDTCSPLRRSRTRSRIKDKVKVKDGSRKRFLRNFLRLLLTTVWQRPAGIRRRSSFPSLPPHRLIASKRPEDEDAASHHLAAGVALLLLEHGRVQRHPSPGPVLAGEHHHGRLHLGHRFQAGLQHMGGGHGEPVGVGVPGLQPAALLLTHSDTGGRVSVCDACPLSRLNTGREGPVGDPPPAAPQSD